MAETTYQARFQRAKTIAAAWVRENHPEIWRDARVAAGLTPETRKATCGTRSGTKAHRRRGEKPCDACRAERAARLGMVRTYRRVTPTPIVEWQKATRGVGEHLLARLLGAIGDPLIATPKTVTGKGVDRVIVEGGPYERTVSQLWRYCGWSPEHRPFAGMSQADMLGCGKGHAKMICRLLAEAQVKSNGAYRATYDASKAHAHEAHEDWTPGHCHNHALRVVAKAILRDLWRIRQGLPALVHDRSVLQGSIDERGERAA